MTKPTLIALVIVSAMTARAQDTVEHKSIHQLENERHANESSVETPRASTPARPLFKRASGLAKKVLGWHPYWVSSSAYLSYDFNALTHIAYFSYETDTATGSYTSIHSWSSTTLIDFAHQHGVKVVLTVTNFGSAANSAFLSDTNKQNTMINQLVSLLLSRNGDGVDFDFESVPASQRTSLVQFVQRAARQIRQDVLGAEVSMATPAVDWSNAWDFASLAQACDYLVLMGYDYYWSGSATAGPVAPLAGESYNVTRSIETYLAAGVSQNKLMLGVPWYGYDWPVTSNARKSSATAKADAKVYSVAEPMAAWYGKIFDTTTVVPYVSYQSGTQWHQLWYDDSLSLAKKYELVNLKQIAGIGIWALSYEGGRSEIWSGIKAAFTPATAVERREGLPEAPALGQNFPNPFNPTTTISYELSVAGHVVLNVFDVLGREVAALVNEEEPPGRHIVQFTASDSQSQIPSGIYFYRLTVGSNSLTRKMIVTK